MKFAAVGRKFLKVQETNRVFGSLRTGLAIINKQGKIYASNRVFREIFGCASGLIQENSLFLSMIGLTPSGFKRFIGSNYMGKTFLGAPCTKVNGERIQVSYRITDIRGGKILIEIQDTTDVAAKEIVSSVNLAMVAVGEKATRVTHGLKGSVSALQNTLTILKEAPEMFSGFLPNLCRIADRISEIIQHVLQVPTVQGERVAEIDFMVLIRQILTFPEMENRFLAAGVSVTIEGISVVAEVDPDAIKEALICIIENAVESIAEKEISGGRVRIAISKKNDYPVKKVEVEIADNGCGIPPEKLPVIFQPFYTTKKRGSGIGLSIARKVIEDAHGGTISVESQVGTGSVFRIKVPLRVQRNTELGRCASVGDKIESLRLATNKQDGEYNGLVEQFVASCTIEHLSEGEVEDLITQARGQINRLLEYLETKVAHISVNNFSKRTEVVVACSKDSSTRNYWVNFIFYELQRMGLEGQISVYGSRKIEKDRAVCRVFEIKKMRGKLADRETVILEKKLREGFTPLPSLEEMDEQERFIRAISKNLNYEQGFYGINSLIYRVSMMGKLRLVGYRLQVFPTIDASMEETIMRRFLMEKPTPIEMLSHLIEQQEKTDDELLVVGFSPLDKDAMLQYQVGPLLGRVFGAFNINSILAGVFVSEGGSRVVNLLCSSDVSGLSKETGEMFTEANKDWIESLKKRQNEH